MFRYKHDMWLVCPDDRLGRRQSWAGIDYKDYVTYKRTKKSAERLSQKLSNKYGMEFWYYQEPKEGRLVSPYYTTPVLSDHFLEKL